MSSIVILRASAVVVLTLVLIPIYLIGLFLDYFFWNKACCFTYKKALVQSRDENNWGRAGINRIS